MPNFGLKIFYQDGPDVLLDSSCTMCCILGICWVGQRQTGIFVPDGYQYYMHLTNGSGYNIDFEVDEDGTNIWVCGAFDSRSYLDHNRQVILENGANAWGYGGDSGSGYNQLCIIIGYPIHNPASGFGISFTGQNNFFSINQTSLCAPVVFKGDITISAKDGWRPSNINPYLNFNNCAVFVYSENQDLSIGIGYNRDIDEHVLFAHNTDGVKLSRDISIKVVVFAKQEIVNTQSKYGMRIYNASGEIVYDSTSGILINPQLFSFGSINLREFVNIPNIRRPMFIPTSIGGYASFDKYSGVTKQVGFASNGFSLAPSYINHENYEWTHPFNGKFTSNFPLMILDAENYFKF
ncbi:hypothetical protein A9G42_05710 [Gilliamella sp. Nev6-6]|uniref:hypothetical protein n=1 Tax=Gilliamella sp. Nev6-6 TaxID=3120252 RepID=UPI00080F3A50|nr:hypothetical protein [Gilliamella apicola]OCG77400.1 hypothetical protein A9G42_05710 [Gilliamella apicola]